AHRSVAWHRPVNRGSVRSVRACCNALTLFTPDLRAAVGSRQLSGFAKMIADDPNAGSGFVHCLHELGFRYGKLPGPEFHFRKIVDVDATVILEIVSLFGHKELPW